MDGAILGVRVNTLWKSEGNKAAHAWLGEKLHLLVQEDPMYSHIMYSHEVDYAHQLQLAEFYLLCQRYGDQWYKKHQEYLREFTGENSQKLTIAREM